VADLGVLRLAGRHTPGLQLHISTQAGIVNYESARAFYELGAKRVILARELSLKEIAEIREKTPAELELETFVHGSVCVSFSGRCVLSNYLTGRDANRGACAQPCRYRYALMEEKRPGEYFPVFEDGEGTHILNSRDLCMIEHIPELLRAGVSSLKIEGRMKTAYYAAVITQAYRMAADAAAAGRAVDPVWLEEVEKVSHRPYFTGFYFGPPEDGQYRESSGYIRRWDMAAVVEDCDENGNAVLSQRNRVFEGDPLELLSPGVKPISFTAGEMEDEAGERIFSTPHPKMPFRMRLPQAAPPGAILRRQGPDIDRPE
jgi:putative protease